MYLKKIQTRNFRVFGDGKAVPALDWELAPGLNILVGENDAGKSTVIDAIRQVLWTTSYEFVRMLDGKRSYGKPPPKLEMFISVH
ncbi:AAA family ATPase [Duganella sp. FT27W]|uniref:AAA family ATPase n=1 Tax=Duganella sp. FT27W TaxID=2654636 RepID=UPI00135E920A|nr:AAA family ATPase [Duganella sp. FT27W]